MFVVNPGSQFVLRVLTDKEHYYPVRRLFRLALNAGPETLELMSADTLFSVGLKEVPSFAFQEETLGAGPTLVVALARDLADAKPEDVAAAVYGWGVGLVFQTDGALDRLTLPLPVSHLRPTSMAPDIFASDAWLYVNNHDAVKIDFRQLTPKIQDAIAELSAKTPLKTGDVLILTEANQTVVVKAGDTLRAGVTGVGMLSVQLSKK
ncbi:MAG: hypothetical protein Q4E62_01990 [Sutterellaceae bacterium]|nr:hypothetical protein [Sutterellaceae bacterium]